jgi:hypothetical protein
MPVERIKRTRKKKMRSYRHVMLFLWAFGIAGFGLGMGLIVWGIMADMRMAQLGVVYVLVACILVGVRGILHHRDDVRKRKHVYRTSPRTSL